MNNKDLINKMVAYVEEDQEVKKIIKENHINNQQIVDSFSVLTSFVECKKACDNCKKDGSCQSISKYQIPTLLYEDGKFKTEFTKCIYEQEKTVNSFDDLFFDERNKPTYSPIERKNLFAMINDFINKYLNNEKPKGIYLWGDCGVGKSFILKKTVLLLRDKNIDVCYKNYPDLVLELMALIGKDEFIENISKLKKVDILMLDDVGREANTPYIRDEILGPILQYRMDNHLPVFMTSNHDYKQLEIHLANTNQGNDQIKSKALLERIKCLMVDYHLIGENYREKEDK